MAPLEALKVLDFSTTVPGPLATLILAEAGAKVLKVERKDGGDPGRLSKPEIDGESLQFAMLNKGKRSIAVDLKDQADLDRILRFAVGADILVEQFRPGVMERLGLGYAALAKRNPGLIYCSISGYGQTGPLASRAGHDLTYLARNGILSLGGGTHGEPILPPALIADIGGGTFPAIINILLALIDRNATGQGRHIDVAMAEQVFGWISRQLAATIGTGAAPRPGESSHTGGTPRYGLHRTADGKFVAVAAIEDKFWTNFCTAIDLPNTLRERNADIGAVKVAIADRIGSRPADHWRHVFAGDDYSVEIVADLDEAMNDRHFVEREVFERRLALANGSMVSALPVPLADDFRTMETSAAPAHGDVGPNAASWDEIWAERGR